MVCAAPPLNRICALICSGPRIGVESSISRGEPSVSARGPEFWVRVLGCVWQERLRHVCDKSSRARGPTHRSPGARAGRSK